MNFSILNFSYQRPFLVAITIAVVLLGAVDMAIQFYVARKTSHERFIDNKESKFGHLAQQKSGKPLDAIFVGSSFTKNHISTAVFLKQGFRIYNLGISGRFLADFPSMVKAANNQSPRLIVLNISLDELFIAPTSDFVHLNDLGPLLASSADLSTMSKHVWRFFLSLHSLHYYREPIYEQLRGAIARAIPPRILPSERVLPKSEYVDLELIKIDCEVFKTTTYEKMKVLTCTNGDGVQVGHLERQSPKQLKRFDVSEINYEALSLLNEVITSTAGNSKVVVVLQPMWGHVVTVDLSVLAAQIRAPVLDLTAATFSDRDWCDEHHFNVLGRSKYSSLLVDRLLPYY